MRHFLFHLYAKSIVFGYRLGCHQRSDRSFFWHGYQFPVCARCTGVLLSYFVSLPLYFFFGGSWKVSLLAMAVMFGDWLIQFMGIRESTNMRRLWTGLCGGYGVMTAQILVVKSLLHMLNQFILEVDF